jgi:hypothetical protein
VGGGWHGYRAWARWSAAASGAARHGIHSCTRIEAAHGDDLLPLPDLEGEGAESPVEGGVGAIIERVEGGDHAAPDPDEEGAEEISRELARQLATQIVPGQRKRRSIQRFF